MHENICASVLIVRGLIEITEYCLILEKGSESALMYREFLANYQACADGEHLFLELVYIPVNWSICMKTFA